MKTDYKTVCITNRHLIEGTYPESFFEVIRSAVRQGADMIILREKDLPESEYESLAAEVIKICREVGAMCLLHTYTDAAKRLDHPYIHLPLADLISMPAEDKEFFEVLGASVHSVEEAELAERCGASYITASHIFETDCKKELAPRGLDFLKEVCRSVDIDVYALGGITPDNMNLCRKAGADGACMMSYYMRRYTGRILINT